MKFLKSILVLLIALAFTKNLWAGIEYFDDFVVSDTNSMTWVDSRSFTTFSSGLSSLDGKDKLVLMTEDASLTSDFTEDLSGLTLVVKKGVELTLNGISTIEFNITVEDGGQVIVDQNCAMTGIIISDGNTSGVVAFSGDSTLSLDGKLEAGRWQIFDSNLIVEGTVEFEAVFPEWWHDGGSNWADAIDAAIDFVTQYTNESRPAVSFTSKIYGVSSPILLPSGGIDGIRLIGTGRGRPKTSRNYIRGGTGLLYTGVTQTEDVGFISIGDGTYQYENIVIKDMSLLCQGRLSGICGVMVSQSLIENVFVALPLVGVRLREQTYSNSIYGVEVFEPTTGGIDLREDCHSVTLMDCMFTGDDTGTCSPTYGVRIGHEGNCSNVSVIGTNFDFYRCANHVLLSGNDCKNFNFTGNYIEVRNDGSSVNALSLYNGSGINIAGNRITTASIYTSYNINLGSNCESVSITGNYFSGADVVACIRVGNGCNNVFIAGNENYSNVTLVNNQNSGDADVCYIDNGDVVTDTVTCDKVASEEIVCDNNGELTISSGSVTVTGSLHYIDTESDASSDYLDYINGGEEGQILILQAADDGRTVIVSESGNLRLNGSSFDLDHGQDKIALLNLGGAYWHELFRSDNN